MCRVIKDYDISVAKNSSDESPAICHQAAAALTTTSAQKLKAVKNNRVEQVRFNQFVSGLKKGEYAHAGLLLGDTGNSETSESGIENTHPI